MPKQNGTALGTNVSVTKDDDGWIVLRFNPNYDGGASKSGKTTLVATTHGGSDLSAMSGVPGLKVSLNVYTPAK